MSAFDEIRLEKDGTVVMYLAPNASVRPVASNDLQVKRRPRGRPAIARDVARWKDEIVLRGNFEDSDQLPEDHEAALVALDSDWSAPVSARQQVNRIDHFVHEVGGPFELYEGGNQYTATDPSEVDRRAGVFPTVQISEFRPPSDAGGSRYEYTLKCVQGVVR